MHHPMPSIRSLWQSSITLGLLLLSLPTPAQSATTCNGHPNLCFRAYDDVVYATTHNAFNSFEGSEQYWFVNQGPDIRTQLEDGIRGLMLDVHPFNGLDPRPGDSPYLCHSFCWLGGQPLEDGLTDIRLFMEENPEEVITIIFESYVSAEEIEAAFNDSGLIDHVYTHNGGFWPTLGEMIDNGTRLVVLTDRDGGNPAWHHDVWDLAVETHYSAQSPEDLSCAYNRGSANNDLFILNHFLTAPIARRSLAYQINFNPFLFDRAVDCWGQTGKVPNFLTVDFYTIGDTLDVVDSLNGLD